MRDRWVGMALRLGIAVSIVASLGLAVDPSMGHVVDDGDLAHARTIEIVLLGLVFFTALVWVGLVCAYYYFFLFWVDGTWHRTWAGASGRSRRS